MKGPAGSAPSAGAAARLDELFDRALAAADTERAALLSAVRAADAALHDRLQRLLDAHDELEQDPPAGGFLGGLDPPRAAGLLHGDGAELAPGAGVGRFKLQRRIARGGMGVVYLADDPGLDRRVALKLLPQALSADAAANRRFVEEARAASRLDHPHIATVYEIGEAEDGRLFIAMAFYPGPTLRERLATGPLAAEEAIAIAAQVADGLDAAHRVGIVHRDVKPENLILDTHGAVRILDFGVAKVAASALTRTGATLGTVAYMSPEQTRGEAVDARSDVWSLGVVLFETLAGRRPFRGEATEAVIHGIRHDAPPPLSTLRPELPPALATVVERCLAKDPADRFGSAAELRDALRAAVDERPAARGDARRVAPAPVASPQRPPRSHAPTTLATAATVAALLVVAAIAGWLVRGVPSRVADDAGVAHASAADPAWVVVADFDATADVADVALAAREALLVDLQQSGFVRALGRAQLGPVLERMGRPAGTPLDATTALEVAERAGAGAVVGVAVARLGGQYVLSARAVRPGTGEELLAARVTADETGLLGAVESLSRQVRRGLGEQRDAVRSSRPLPEVSTASLRALRLYAEADRAAASDLQKAAALAAEAIRADPGFAMAHRLAGAIASSQLRHGDAREHLVRAWALRDRLSQRERWQVEAMYHMSVELEPRRAAGAYDLLLRSFGDDATSLFNHGSILASWLREYDRGYRQVRAALTLNPDAPGWHATAIALANLAGRRSEADSLAELAEQRGHVAAVERWRLGRAVAAGEHREAMERCEALLDRAAPAATLAEDREFCGSVDIAGGRFAVGLARLGAAERSFRDAGRYRNVAHTVQAIAAAHVLRGDVDAAESVIAAMLERVPAEAMPEPDRYFTRINLQVHAALLGRPALVARIGAAYPAYPEAEHWIARNGEGLVRAAGAVAARDGAVALAVLDAAVPTDEFAIGWRIWEELIRGEAHMLQSRPDSAAARFRRAADPRYQVLGSMTKDRIHRPHAMRRLAEAEAAAGRSADAVRSYHRLLDMWADADPELGAEAARVRATAARLQTAGRPASM